jgi:hypothetical protein
MYLSGNVPFATARQPTSRCHPRILCYQTLKPIAGRGNGRVTRSYFRLPSIYVPATISSQKFVLLAMVLDDVIVKLRSRKACQCKNLDMPRCDIAGDAIYLQFHYYWMAICDASFDLLDASTNKT